MLKIRWLMLVLGILVVIPAIAKGESQNVIIAFVIGMLYAVIIIDPLGVKVFRFWKYAGTTKTYIFATVPCWGIFGILINIPWDWMHNHQWLAFSVITISLFLLMEMPNLRTKSWEYSVPLWLVAIGWIPLILSYRFLYVIALNIFSHQEVAFRLFLFFNTINLFKKPLYINLTLLQNP